MRTHLSWRDEHGVVHAMFDDFESEYSPPYTLMSACGYGHDHHHSMTMRAQERDEAPTCLLCVYLGHPAWMEDRPTEAPCCR